jgi:hypothetical protein
VSLFGDSDTEFLAGVKRGLGLDATLQRQQLACVARGYAGGDSDRMLSPVSPIGVVSDHA